MILAAAVIVGAKGWQFSSSVHPKLKPGDRELCRPLSTMDGKSSCQPLLILNLMLIFANPTTTMAQDWDMLNGSVRLPDTVNVQFVDRKTGAKTRMELSNPQVIGAGGGGAVFSFDTSDVLLKVSWSGTAKTVQRECATLQYLQDHGVQASERCLASLEYDDTPRNMILVTPYMRDAVASVDEVLTDAARRASVDQIARTLVQMLAANVITIDVQPLISRSTGQLIFIDMTEAQVLASSPSYTFLDQTLISSFVSEMVALIPESYWKVARASILEELNLISKESNTYERTREVLDKQTPFFDLSS